MYYFLSVVVLLQHGFSNAVFVTKYEIGLKPISQFCYTVDTSILS